MGTVVVLAAGLVLVVALPRTVAGWLFGPMLMYLAYTLRPRIPKADDDVRVVERVDAPELYGLLDEIAARQGARAVDLVTLTTGGNAATGAYGWRGERRLSIGVPLWTVLTPQQRLAILAHEVAHGVDGSLQRRLVGVTALDTLHRWYEVAHPLTSARILRSRPPKLRNLVDVIVPLHLVYRGGESIYRRSQPRAEYLADQLAAEIAGTEAMIGALEQLPTSHAAMEMLHRAVDARVPSHPWRLVADFAAGLPGEERERLAVEDAARGACADATHPPTHLRIRMLRERGERRRKLRVGAVRVDAGRAERIEAELAPGAAWLAGQVTAWARR
ncbi:M48 family metallopeptidase [Catenulispora yoronensis]